MNCKCGKNCLCKQKSSYSLFVQEWDNLQKEIHETINNNNENIIHVDEIKKSLSIESKLANIVIEIMNYSETHNIKVSEEIINKLKFYKKNNLEK